MVDLCLAKWVHQKSWWLMGIGDLWSSDIWPTWLELGHTHLKRSQLGTPMKGLPNYAPTISVVHPSKPQLTHTYVPLTLGSFENTYQLCNCGFHQSMPSWLATMHCVCSLLVEVKGGWMCFGVASVCQSNREGLTLHPQTWCESSSIITMNFTCWPNSVWELR